jgi:uncharacterized membrane protein
MSDWYYAENNEQRGPVLEAELKSLLAGKLPTDTLVWKEGMSNWTPAAQVAAFNPALASAAAPVVTSATTTPNLGSVTPITTSDIIGTPEALEVDPDDAEKNKIFGIVAYLSILWLVPLVVAKDSPFAKYHANQGFSLFILEVAVWIIEAVLSTIFYMILPGGGYGIISLVLGFVWLGVLVLVVMGIINAARGKCVPLPLIGGFKVLK